MKSVINQSLCNVLDFHVRGGLELTTIDNALVRDEIAVTFVKRREIRFEPLRNVVGVQDCNLRRIRKAFAAHECDIHPRDGENAGAAPWRRGYRTDTLRAADFSKWMLRQIRSQVPGDRNRSHARAAAPMGDAKRLVQIEMKDIRSDVPGSA